MPMTRGTRITINHMAQMGPKTWCQLLRQREIIEARHGGVVGKVASRKKNGWLRVTIESTGQTISVRNGQGVKRWEPEHPTPSFWTSPAAPEPVLISPESPDQLQVEVTGLKSLSPLKKLEDAAIERTEKGLDSFSEDEEDDDDDEFDIVDPPDDAYGDLTHEQQQDVRRLIGQFTRANMMNESPVYRNLGHSH